jgi:DNA (cytosine-5)-methyltransferase 1
MRRLKYLTVCSGIEAQSTAWDEHWDAVAFADVDPFCNAFLAHKYPSIPNLGDMTAIDWSQIEDTDIFMGSTPCQSFSLAGSRKSLNDSRGQLTKTFVEAWNELTARDQCPILFWENVDGVLSTKDNAFGCMLAAILGEEEPIASRRKNGKWSRSGFFLGQHRSVAYRVVDAQYFGVPQRRNRIFLCAINTRVLGKLFPQIPAGELSGLGGIPAAILFEPEGERRAVAKVGKAKGKAAKAAKTGIGEPPQFCREELLAIAIADHLGLDPSDRDWQLANEQDVAGPILANCGTKQWLGNQDGFSGKYHLVKEISFSSNDNLLDAGEVCPPIRRGGHSSNAPAIAFSSRDQRRSASETCPAIRSNNAAAIAFSSVDNGRDAGEVCPPIRSGKHDQSWMNGRGGGAAIALEGNRTTYITRRFTPTECLRLMGFPDDHLDFMYQNKPASDTRKYAAIGNSIAVPCLSWLQRRTVKVLDAIAESLN